MLGFVKQVAAKNNVEVFDYLKLNGDGSKGALEGSGWPVWGVAGGTVMASARGGVFKQLVFDCLIRLGVMRPHLGFAMIKAEGASLDG